MDFYIIDIKLYTVFIDWLVCTYISTIIITQSPSFFVLFVAVGCADITPPRHGRVERDGDHAVVRCNVSDQIWRLTCLGNHWQGQAGNCSVGRFNAIILLHI